MPWTLLQILVGCWVTSCREVTSLQHPSLDAASWTKRQGARARTSSPCIHYHELRLQEDSSSWHLSSRRLTRTLLWGSGDEEYNEYDDDADWDHVDDDEEEKFDSIALDKPGQEQDLHINGATAAAALPNLKQLSNEIAHTQQQLQLQQQQINQILQLLLPGQMPKEMTARVDGQHVPNLPLSSSSSSLSSSWPTKSTTTTTASGSSVVPLRVMVFIDGTWTYYSLFKRDSRCMISQKFGFGWHLRYRFNWEALPGVISRALQKHSPWQDKEARPLEIARMSVYTSYKADTLESSNRYQIFQDMRAAGYDVFTLETVGRGEKCVDIQLAVEMMHYATVPNAYDVAVLLSGDKDFMPALIRVRQKGRKVAIVSMKSGVNRALVETDGLKDYDIVWLEDYLDELIVPKDDPVAEQPNIHPFIILRCIWEFVKCSGLQHVSSRDIGRYLKSMRLRGPTATFLDEIKTHHMGLNTFLKRSGLFDLVTMEGEKIYLVSLVNDAGTIERAHEQARLEPNEERFLRECLASMPTDKQMAYYFTINDGSQENESGRKIFVPALATVPAASNLPDDLTVDYATYTVPMLKERCRERGLAMSGRKVDLLERVQKDVEEQVAKLKEKQMRSVNSENEEVANHILELIKEYVHASGGKASSRDIGRYLAANTRKSPGSNKQVSANTELKANFGSLTNFVNLYDNIFDVDEDFEDGQDSFAKYAFCVSLKKS